MSRRAFAVLATAVLALAACQAREAADPRAMEGAFLDRIREMCGRSLTGRATFAADTTGPLWGATLTMHVAECGPEEIRIPLVAGADRSRTWILTPAPEGLLLKHDHRHPDGTPDDITHYGGVADGTGTATRQRFPADAYTAELLPEARTNVWTLEIDDEQGLFVYDLQRHGQPRFRAEFDLTR